MKAFYMGLFNWPTLDGLLAGATDAPVIYLTGNPGTGRALIAAKFLLADPTTGPALWINVTGNMPILSTAIADSWKTANTAGRIQIRSFWPGDGEVKSDPVNQLRELIKSQKFSRIVIHNCDLLTAPDAHATYAGITEICRENSIPAVAVGTIPHLGMELDLSPVALSATADFVLTTRLHLSPSGRYLSISLVRPAPVSQSESDKPFYYQINPAGLEADLSTETNAMGYSAGNFSRGPAGYKRTYTFMPEVIYFSADQERYIRARVEAINSKSASIQVQLPEKRYTSPLEYNRHFEEFKQGHRHWDLFIADVYRLRELVEDGLIWSLNELMPANWRERFLPVALDQCTIDGHLVGIPHWINIGVLIYRTDLLNRYGLTPPRSWDELVEHSRIIMEGERRENFSGFLFQGAPSETLTINFLEFLWNNGGDVFDQPLRIAIDSPQAKKSLQFMCDLIYKHKVSPLQTTALSETESGRRFHNGHAAFLRGWPQVLALSPRRKILNAAQIDLTALPTRNGKGPGQSVIGGFCFVIPKYVENPAALLDFFQKFASEEAVPELAIRGWTCPPYLSAYENRDVIRHRPYYSRILEMMRQGRARKNIPYYEALSGIIQGEVSDALRGLKSPATALENIAGDLHNRVYKQVRELRLQRVIEYIDHNLHEDLSRDKMAKISNLSPSYFSTLFTETMNRPFARYVNEKRIDRARHLLETTEMTIGEIAESVGFKNQGYFCNVFREETRVPPSRYRLDALAKVTHR